jgi:hypothetical protein
MQLRRITKHALSISIASTKKELSLTIGIRLYRTDFAVVLVVGVCPSSHVVNHGNTDEVVDGVASSCTSAFHKNLVASHLQDLKRRGSRSLRFQFMMHTKKRDGEEVKVAQNYVVYVLGV